MQIRDRGDQINILYNIIYFTNIINIIIMYQYIQHLSMLHFWFWKGRNQHITQILWLSDLQIWCMHLAPEQHLPDALCQALSYCC